MLSQGIGLIVKEKQEINEKLAQTIEKKKYFKKESNDLKDSIFRLEEKFGDCD